RRGVPEPQPGPREQRPFLQPFDRRVCERGPRPSSPPPRIVLVVPPSARERPHVRLPDERTVVGCTTALGRASLLRTTDSTRPAVSRETPGARSPRDRSGAWGYYVRRPTARSALPLRFSAETLESGGRPPDRA